MATVVRACARMQRLASLTTIAELVASQKTPQLIEPFKLSRFYEDRLVSERGAAAVSH